MQKKLICLVVALLMMSTAAFAVPSKTTADLVVVEKVVSSTGAVVADNFVIAPLVESETATAELIAISAFVTANVDAPIVNYFPTEVKDAITEVLPEGVEADSLVMDELIPLTIENYDEAYGDVVITMDVTTEYTDGQVLVVLFGVTTGEVDATGAPVINWLPLTAEVVDVLVQITFTQEALLASRTGDVMLAILSEPIFEESAE